MCAVIEKSGAAVSSPETKKCYRNLKLQPSRNNFPFGNLDTHPPGIPLPKSRNSTAETMAATEVQHHAAAVKLQKIYKGYRTRRNLADCAVVVEELWY